jgi:hypothetical protein
LVVELTLRIKPESVKPFSPERASLQKAIPEELATALDNIDQVKTDSSRFTVLSVWGATTSGAVNGHLIAIRVALRPKMLTENAGADLVQLALEAWGTDVVACPDLMRKWGNALGMWTGDRKGARHPAQGAGCTGAHSAPPLRP